MSQKRDKGNSQKGKPNSNTVDPVIAAEDVEKQFFQPISLLATQTLKEN
ncbi:hypothetical protein F3K44_02435 [Bacillus megaterium]|nr:hypothetical protein [Priestia megaterium]